MSQLEINCGDRVFFLPDQSLTWGQDSEGKQWETEIAQSKLETQHRSWVIMNSVVVTVLLKDLLLSIFHVQFSLFWALTQALYSVLNSVSSLAELTFSFSEWRCLLYFNHWNDIRLKVSKYLIFWNTVSKKMKKLEFRVKTSLKKKTMIKIWDITIKQKHSKKTYLAFDTHLIKCELKGPKKLHSDLKRKFDLHFLHFKYAEAFGTQ